MLLNDATPRMEVDPETYEVRADGRLLTCEPARILPQAQRYFTLLRTDNHAQRFYSDQGEDILLDLPKTVAMADGDGLQLDDGTWLAITAASEPLVEVRHKDRHQLMRLAWHLGNRHLPTEIRENALRIRPDHVMEETLQGFGAGLVRVHAAFQPEGGAYGGTHNHDHHHHQHDQDDGARQHA
jgi:urease accessory protein